MKQIKKTAHELHELTRKEHSAFVNIRVNSWAILLLLSFALLSAPQADAADWVKAYKKGDYTNAFQALETMTNNFPDIGSYNRGNVLYRQKNFQGSEKAYSEAAALTKDDSLKQKALYNRGTALLAGTTTQTDPSKIDEKIAAATQAASLFEQALTIKPDDLDAKQNLERALKLKEQLEKQKQQQEQQKQDQNNQDQKQNQKNQDQQKDQNKQDQQQKQDQQKDQSNQDQQNQQNQDQQKGSQGQQDQNKDQQPQDQQQQQSAQPKQAGEMSKEEAQQLLDAMKQGEQDQRANLKPFLGGPVRVDKDW